jgi:cytidylate kinase
MLIHISGPSGSGKSYLANKLSAKYTVFDLDIIDDKHALEVLAVRKYYKAIIRGDMNIVYAERDRLNKQWLDTVVKPRVKSGETIILVGLPFGYLSADKKYVIGISGMKNYEDQYRRVYLRTLREIVAASDDIEKMMKQALHPEIIKYTCVHKHKIRQDFIGPFYPSLDGLKKFYEQHKRKGYKIMTQDKIFETINRTLKAG